MSSENAIFESTRNALKKAQEYSVQLDPKTNPDVQSNEFIGTTPEELVKLRNELNSALLNTDPAEQKRLVEGIQARAMSIRNRLAEISLSDAFQKHIEANKKLVSDIETIHGTIKVINTEQIPTITQRLDPQKNGGITSATFGEKLKPAIVLYEKAKKAYAELLTSKEKPAEQLIKLQAIQQQFLAAKTAFQEIALKYYESDILAVSDKRFSDSIASKLKAETPPDNAEILAAMPGENDKEKAWNYRLLAAYSDSFTTPKVPRLKPKPSTTEAQSRFDKLWNFTSSWFKYGQDQIYPDATSMMDSLKKASGQHNIFITTIPTYNRNGPWIPDKTDSFKQKGSFQPQISRTSLTDTVLSIANNPTDEGAKHLADIAESLNNLRELAPVYLSLAKEHYFILLAQRDATVQPPAKLEGRESLPTEGLKKEYDAFRASRGSKSAQFEWKGVDSKGWDFSPFKDDTYEFADIDDEKIFLESSMKLLPVFDNIDEKYLEAALGDWPIFDHAKSLTNIVANGATDKVRGILKWAIGEGGTAALGVLASLRSPNAFLLGQLLDKLGVRENEGFDDLPLLLMIFRIIRQTRVLALAISLVRPVSSRLVKIVPYVGPLLHVLVEKKIAGGDTYSNVSDVLRSMFRSSAERVVDLDKKKGISVQGKDGLERLKSDEPSYKQYTTLLNIIDQRIAAGEGGTVEVPVYDPNGHPTENVTLDGLSPEFGRILKELVADSVCEAYLAEAVQQKGKTEQEKLGFRDGKNGDKIVTFVPDKRFWLKMVEDAFASPHPWEQVRTGNAPDISRLNNGFSRNFGFIRTEDQIDGTGTFRHVLRRWGAGTLGNVSNAYTYRLPSIPGVPDSIPSFISDAQQAYHNRMSVDGLLFGRGYADAALSYVKQLAKHLPETLKVELIDGDNIHHDVEALQKYGYKLKETDKNDTAHFDQPNEQELLRNCHFEGQFPKNGWKVAVVTMLIMTRGTKGDLVNSHVPATFDNGHHHFDLQRCADAYENLSATQKKAINALFNQVLPPDHSAPLKVEPRKIMEAGNFLRVLPTIPGAVDGIDNSGKARPEISRLEGIYFTFDAKKPENDAAETAEFDAEYEKCFSEHTKEYGQGYDSEKHLHIIHEIRKTFEFMARDLMKEVTDGKVTTEAEMKDKIDKHVEKKGKNMPADWNTAHITAQNVYNELMKKLKKAVADVAINSVKDETAQEISDAISMGSLQTNSAIAAKVASATADPMNEAQKKIFAQKVAAHLGLTLDSNTLIKNGSKALETGSTAVAYIIEQYQAQLETQIQSMRSSMDISNDPTPSVLLPKIKAYRKYPDSIIAGRKLVIDAYSYLEKTLTDTVNMPADYYALLETYKKNNPETSGTQGDNGTSGFRAEYEAMLAAGEAQCVKFQNNEIGPQLTTLTSEPDFRKLQSKFTTEKQNIQNKYGVSLCTFGGANQLEEAQRRFDAKEAIYVSAEIAKLKSTHEFPTYAAFDDPTNGALSRVNNLEREFPKYSSEFTAEKTRIQNVRSGHTAVQQLCAQIQSGSVALDDVNTQFDRVMNGYPAYKDMYLLEANTSIEQAKKAVVRTTSTPNTPLPAPEAQQQNPSENPTELLKNEMTELESTEAYKNYQADSANNDKYDALILEMSQGKYSNLRDCYRCADRILGEQGLQKYGPTQILTMLKASTVDANGTVVLSLPAGDTVDEVQLRNTFRSASVSPVDMMMRMDMSGMGRSRVELHTTGIIDKRFELHIHK